MDYEAKVNPDRNFSKPFIMTHCGKELVLSFRELTAKEEAHCRNRGLIYAGIQKAKIEAEIKRESGELGPFEAWATYGANFDAMADHGTELERLTLALVDSETGERMFKTVEGLENLFSGEVLEAIANRYAMAMDDFDPDRATGEDIEAFIEDAKKNLHGEGPGYLWTHYPSGLILASVFYMAELLMNSPEDSFSGSPSIEP
jgi:hypothetical protein